MFNKINNSKRDEDEIAIIYYRTGYTPNHFESEEIWKLRLDLELNKAIKCPSINLVLINFKKIQ